mgnify:CR=1 FL=1
MLRSVLYETTLTDHTCETRPFHVPGVAKIENSKKQQEMGKLAAHYLSHPKMPGHHAHAMVGLGLRDDDVCLLLCYSSYSFGMCMCMFICTTRILPTTRTTMMRIWS